MNIFLLVHFRRGQGDVFKLEEFEDLLPCSPSQARVVRTGSAFLASWTINEFGGRSYTAQDANHVLSVDGLPTRRGHVPSSSANYLAELLRSLASKPSMMFDELCGEFSLAYSDGAGSALTSNVGGSHAVYYVDRPDFVAFTNRGPLLLALPGVSADLSPEASALIAYQGYVTQLLTPFSSMRKLQPGAMATVDTGGRLHIRERTYADLIDPNISEAFAEKPQATFRSIFDEVTRYLFTLKKHNGDLPLNLPLSGGKDSRLMLALLLGAGLKDELDIWTRGPLYSPDVVSAAEVCKRIGYSRHVIKRPEVSVRQQPFAKLALNSLNYLEGNLSLYDTQHIARDRFLTVGGHQNALRPGSFSACRLGSIEEFIDDALRARHRDPLKVTRPGVAQNLEKKYADFFRTLYEAGVPIHQLGDLYYLWQRNANWVSVYSNSDSYSGPMTNPLMHGDVYRFVFSVPLAVRKFELFHYLGMACTPALLDVPFGNQAWQPGIDAALRQLGINAASPVRTPYRSHRAFPNMANPYISNIKVEMVRALHPVAQKLLQRHRDYFGQIFDIERVTKASGQPEKLSFAELYAVLGIFGNAVVKEYGKDVFRRSQQAALASELQDQLTEMCAA